MKTTPIHLLRASAIGLWLYAALTLGRIVLRWANLWHTMCLNGKEAYIYGYSIIEIVSIAIICFTLYGMRKFYKTYPDEKGYTLCSQLPWSHNRLIMRVDDPSAREWYSISIRSIISDN